MILFGQVPLGSRPEGSWPLRSLVGTVAEEIPAEAKRRSRGRNPLLVVRGIDDPPVHDDPELLLLLHSFLEVIQ